MKIRTDFVTNSSSSSFVIAYKPTPNYDEETLKKYPLLRAYDKIIEILMESEQDCDTEQADIFTNIGEYNTYILQQYNLGKNVITDINAELPNEYSIYLGTEYERVVHCLAEGYHVAYKCVGHHDDILNIIRNVSENNDDFIIVSEGW